MSFIRNNIILLFAVVIAILLPFSNSTIIISIGVVAFIYAIAALGLNVVVGWTGLLDLGASGFVAIGAYLTAILLMKTNISFIYIIFLVIVFGFIIGIVLGIPTLRHRSDYFAILTLGFAELVSLMIRNWTPVTGGSYGLSNIPNLILFGYEFKAIPPKGFYYLSLLLLVLSFICLSIIRKSRLGRMFHIIKHNENVANVYGISPVLTKVLAFGISASIVSLSGLMWSSYYSSITWSQFDILLSCIFLSLIIVGGSGNLKGVLIGGVVISASIEIIRIILVEYNLPQNMRFFLFSVILILFIRLKPRGILPDKPNWFRSNQKIRKPNFQDHQFANNHSLPISLNCKNISKSFDGIVALDNVSFEINNNEIVGLIGPNGSGKTTFMNIISGLIKQDSGTIIFNNTDISGLKSYKRAKLGIRRSFQHNDVIDDISCIDNVLLPSKTSNLHLNLPQSIKKLINSDVITKKVSFGEKKMLDVVRLFTNAPNNSILLMDEPTSGLNQAESEELVDFIKYYQEIIQCSILLVSHDTKFLEKLELDRLIILNHGEVFADGKLSDLKNDSKVQEIFWKKDIL